MCIFCAAIPMTISIGAAAASKQHKAQRIALERGDSQPTRLSYRLPIPKLTTAAVITLAAGSITYHTILAPKIGL